MSKKICYRDQDKLNQILEQVEDLSDIVDELKTELNYLKKIFFIKNHENVCFIKENKIDYARVPNVLRKVKAYFKNIEIFARIEPCELTKNGQVSTEKGQEPVRFSTIYNSLQYFKNRITKNIENVRKTPQFPKSTKNKCVISSREQQKTCFLRKKEKQKFLKLNRRNEDVNKYTDEKLDNSADTSFISDNFEQKDITIFSQEDDKKLHNYNCFASQNVRNNNEQTSPMSMINDDGSVIHSDEFTDVLSKNRVKQNVFLKNKIKKYRKCSCGEQCRYALYKLPCDEYRCSTPEKKVNYEISGLTLECLSFRDEKDFPFTNVDTIQNECFTHSSSVEIGMHESSISSLSVDLEIDICNDYYNLNDVDEFTKRRKARTYIVSRTRKDGFIKDFKAENESFNIISSRRNINEENEKIDEIVKKVLSQKRYIYFEENNQDCKKSGTGDFIVSQQSIKNNEQIQCIIPALITPGFNRKMSVKTSTSSFQQKDIQFCRTVDKVRYNSFPKIIIPRRMKTNVQTQTDKCSNCLQNVLSFFG